MYDDVNWFCIILCFVTNLMSCIQLNDCVGVTCVVLMPLGLSMRIGGHTWVVVLMCSHVLCCYRSEYEDWRPHLGSLLQPIPFPYE